MKHHPKRGGGGGGEVGAGGVYVGRLNYGNQGNVGDKVSSHVLAPVW